MALLTGRRVLPVLNSSSWHKFAPLIILGCGLSSGQEGPAYVANCQPCVVRPAAATPEYEFAFDLKTTAGGRQVEAIRVRRDHESVELQKLVVPEMMAIGPDEKFFFGGVDINFDGFPDLMLITEKGAANASALYWLFDPKSGKYVQLGKFPVFRVEPRKRRLSTYETGGAGGMIFDSREYEFNHGILVLVREEKQSATANPVVFRKVIRERIDGVLKTLKTRMVRADLPA